MMSPFFRPAFDGGTVGIDRRHQHAARDRQLVEARQRAGNRHRLARHADVASAHAAVPNQVPGHEARRAARDGEAQAMSRLDHRRVDADHRAGRIDQRTAGVAGIERRIGLNDVFDQPSRLRAQRAADGADDARRDRVMEAVRVADRDGDLADAHVGASRPAMAQAQGLSFGGDAHDGEI